MSRFDHEAIVVGGGAMGAATAWHLARHGRDVLLVERFAPGHAHGSSHGHTRIFRVAYRDGVYTSFALTALEAWRRLEQDSGETLLDLCGQIDHGAPEALADIRAALDAHGRSYDAVPAATAAERWPGIRIDGAALWSPDGGLVAADRSVAALYRVAVEAGATVATNTPVRRVEVLAGGDGARIVTDDGSWTAPVVVVAAGAWAGELLDGVVPMPPLTVTLAAPSHFSARAGGPTQDPWPSVVHYVADGAPLGFGAYAVWAPGVGMKVGLEDHAVDQRSVDPTARSASGAAQLPPDDMVTALAGYVSDWFPGLDPRPLDPHTCLFTNTPDEHFLVDRRGPLVVVSPCSGHGFKFVPAIGRLAAALAESADEDARDVDRPGQWRLPVR